MGRRKRRAAPEEFVVDVERGEGAVGVKSAVLTRPEVAAQRQQTRSDLSELDGMTEAMAGLTRQQRDRARIVPRESSADLGHERMLRRLPEPDSVRTALSSRQRKDRSKLKRATQARLPRTQKQALAGLVGDEETWVATNGLLYEHVGDTDAVDEVTAARVARVDRAIQRYEAGNRRGHVVYSNVRLPGAINAANLESFARNHFTVGDRLAFDQYTVGSLCLHEVEPGRGDSDAGRTAVFEIQTRRGMYLGASDSQDDTAHLLPRGLTLEVVGTHQARWRATDGTTGERTVVQLVDSTLNGPDDLADSHSSRGGGSALGGLSSSDPTTDGPGGGTRRPQGHP